MLSLTLAYSNKDFQFQIYTSGWASIHPRSVEDSTNYINQIKTEKPTTWATISYWYTKNIAWLKKKEEKYKSAFPKRENRSSHPSHNKNHTALSEWSMQSFLSVPSSFVQMQRYVTLECRDIF